MFKEYFYLRVSTQSKGEEGIKQREQTFERQKGILERAGYVLTEENTFAERISGKTKADEREQYEKMLEKLQAGDWVIFSETSRFSRNYIQGMQMLDTLIFDKKVNVRFVSNAIDLYAGEKFSPYVWYTISQMLLADELQRRVISYNTSNGLKRIKEQGTKRLGKPCSFGTEIYPEIVALRKQGLSFGKIAEKLGMSRYSVATICKREMGGE